MALFPSLKVTPPKKSNHDLSRKLRTTMAPGLLYPISFDRLIPGDKIEISVESLIKTYPLLAPLMGSFKLQIDFFFTPYRLYVPNYYTNRNVNTAVGGTDVTFPYFNIANGRSEPNVPSDNPLYFNFATLNNSHLLSYLGFPPGFRDYSALTVNRDWGVQRYSAFPLLSYLDIFRNYYLNRQEDNFFYFSRSNRSASSTVIYEQTSVLQLDDLFDKVLERSTVGNAIQELLPTFLGDAIFGFLNVPLGGLMPRCYLPDVKNIILSLSQFNSNASVSNIDTSSGSFTLDQFNLSSKLYKLYNLLQLAGPRYSEWVRSQYAVKSPVSSNAPYFVGSTSTDIVFEDVVSTAESGSQELGTLAGRGRGYGNGQRHYFTADEPGIFMSIASLIPRVDYYQYIDRALLDIQQSDIFVNELNGLGFQDVLVSDLNAVDPTSLAWSDPPYNGPFDITVGKQPAWIDRMTQVNQVRGDFAGNLRYWTLARNMATNPLSAPGIQNAVVSAYVQPGLYNYAFADTSETAQNFFGQFAINLRKRSFISKRLIPVI